MVPGKKMELNEGIRLLTGNAKIDVPLKKKEAPAAPRPPQPRAATPRPTAASTGPVTTRCTVEEKGHRRTFTVTLEPVSTGAVSAARRCGPARPRGPAAVEAKPSDNGSPVYSTFAGTVEVVDILVKRRRRGHEGQTRSPPSRP